MQVFIFILIGLAGGIFGGMGMGGGTLLIPLLVTFTALSQHSAQTVNLVAFVPMAVVVLIIHIKNGLVKPKYLLTISLPATIIGIGSAILVRYIEDTELRRYFGIFLLLLGVYQLVCVIKKFIIDKKLKKQKSLTAFK